MRSCLDVAFNASIDAARTKRGLWISAEGWTVNSLVEEVSLHSGVKYDFVMQMVVGYGATAVDDLYEYFNHGGWADDALEASHDVRDVVRQALKSARAGKT